MSNSTDRAADLFELAVELCPSGMLAVDASGKILLVNREMERLFGYTREELLGRSVDSLVPERVRRLHSAFRADYQKTATTRPMGSGRQLYGLRKDGIEFPLEIGLNPVQTQSGVVVLASVVDVSARKRAEQRFEAAVESAPSGMVMTDEQGIILLVNRETERLFGYDRAELIGQPVEVLVPHNSRATHPSQRAGYHSAPRTRRMGAGRELFGLRKDGSQIAIEIGLNPIRTDTGVYVLSSIVDISARRRIEEQLRQSQKLEAVGTLAGGIAHDFNNILMGIIGYTELAARAATGKQREDLGQVLMAAERGRQLVQRILTFSRQREVARVPVKPGHAVREAMSLLRASLPSSIEMRESIDPNTPEVLSDETQLHQIVMNLATNAAHAMPTGGTISISLAGCVVDETFVATHPTLSPGLHVKLVVQDTGHGMTGDVLNRVFEPFFTTKAAQQGTGLGLSVIHGIVQSHGGVVELHSRPGQGTKVEIYLPAYQRQAAVDSGTVRVAPRIVVVDDETQLAALMERQLDAMGYQVTAFTSPVDALHFIREHGATVELLITDNTMPKMTGLALVKEVLNLLPGLPVLLVSGLSDTANAEPLYRQGVRKLLAKPHTSRELAEAVESLIGGPPRSVSSPSV